ncbi:MAG: hypothetical protein AVDCRST_MAG48-1402, partial [uncultured Friedmanniella sp.]
MAERRPHPTAAGRKPRHPATGQRPPAASARTSGTARPAA